MPGGQDAGVDSGLARRYSIFDDDDALAQAPPAAPAPARDAGSVVDAARRVQQVRDAGTVTQPARVEAPMRDAGAPPPARGGSVPVLAEPGPTPAPASYWAQLEDHRGQLHRVEASSIKEINRQFDELEARTQAEGGRDAHVTVSDADDASMSDLISPAFAAYKRKLKAGRADGGVSGSGGVELRVRPVREADAGAPAVDAGAPAQEPDAGAPPPPARGAEDAGSVLSAARRVQEVRDAGAAVTAPGRAPARYWALLEDHRGKQHRLEARSVGEVRRQFRELEDLTQDEGGPGAYVLVSDGDDASLSDLTSPEYAAELRKRKASRDAGVVAQRGAAPSSEDVVFSPDEVAPVRVPSRRDAGAAPSPADDMTFTLDEVEPVVARPRRDAGTPAVRRVATVVDAPEQEMGPPALERATVDAPEQEMGPPVLHERAPTDAGVAASRAALTDAGAEPIARTVQARDIVAAGPPPPRDAGAVRAVARSVNDPRDPRAPVMQLRGSSPEEVDRLESAYMRTRAPDAGVPPSYEGLHTPSGQPARGMSATVVAPNGSQLRLTDDSPESLARYFEFTDRHGTDVDLVGEPYLMEKLREAQAHRGDAGTRTMDAGVAKASTSALMDAGRTTEDAAASPVDATRRAAEVVRDAGQAAARALPDAGGNAYGALEPGNIDLTRRPHVRNADGSVSTVYSMGTEINGKQYLIPLVHDDGYIMTPDQGIAEFERTGKHLGVYASPEDSDRAAQAIHEDQERNPPIDTLTEKDDGGIARVAQAARVVSDAGTEVDAGNVNKLPEREPRAELDTGARADIAAAAPAQEQGPPPDLPLDTTLAPHAQEKQMLEGEKRVADVRVQRAEGAAEGAGKVAEQYGKMAERSAGDEERMRQTVTDARRRAGTLEQRMVGLMDHIEFEEHGKPKRDTLHLIMSILTSVLLAKLPGGAAAAKMIMQAMPTATNKWAERLSGDREAYDRLARMYGLSSHANASELEQEAMLSAAGAGTLKAGLNSIINSNASEDAKKLARETLELANNQIRGHARDIGSRELRNAYAQLPLESLQSMDDANQLGAEGQAVLHEKRKVQQAERKAEIDAQKGVTDIEEAPVRRKKLEGEVAAEQAEAPLRQKKMENENAEAPLRQKALEAEVRLKNANALEAEARAKFGPKHSDRETQLDVLTRSGSQSFERLAKMAKAGKTLPTSAMALGATLSKLDPNDAQTRRDVGLLLSLVLRNESGAVIGENEWDQRFNELGLNSTNEGIRRNALSGLLQSFEGMDRLQFLSSIDWSKDPPNAITAKILAEATARQKAQEGAGERNATEGQTGRGAGRVTGKGPAAPAPAAEPKDPQLEAKRGFDARELAARMKLTEAARSSTPAVMKVYNEENEERKAGGDVLFEALRRDYTLTPKPRAMLDYYRGIREARQRGKAPAGGAR
jgi:hypothetical protein